MYYSINILFCKFKSTYNHLSEKQLNWGKIWKTALQVNLTCVNKIHMAQIQEHIFSAPSQQSLMQTSSQRQYQHAKL